MCYDADGLLFAQHPPSGLAYELSAELFALLDPRPGARALPVFPASTAGAELSPDLAAEVADDWAWLKRLGYLPQAPPPLPGVHALTLDLVHGCNFNCSYCSVGPEGLYGGPATRMSQEVAERAIDYVAERASTQALRLLFFGGEPLLNWDVVVGATRYAAEAYPETRWHLGLVTNGALITPERAEFLARHRIRSLITLSGEPAMHDLHRPDRGGGSTHARVLAGVRAVLAAGAPLTLQAVITRDMLEEHGYTLAKARAYLEGVAGPETALTVKFEDGYHTSCAQPGSLLLEDDRRRLEQDLEGGFPRDLRAIGSAYSSLFAGLRPVATCKAGSGHMHVLPDGGLQTCHISAALEGAARAAYALGSVGAPDVPQLEALYARNTTPHGQCSTCWLRGICPRGCHLAVDAAGGQVPESSCRENQTTILEGVRVAAKVAWDVLAADVRSSTRPEAYRAFEQAFALRERLRKVCKHLKPIFAFPQLREGGDEPPRWGLAASVAAGARALPVVD